MFPSFVTHEGPDGKAVADMVPIKEGTDMHSISFDMWRPDHPDALQDVPGDLLTPSASGLDPHITLQNAEFQLDRISGIWARELKRDPAELRREIEQMLRERAFAPDAGLFKINVLQIDLDLRKRYGASA